MGAMDIHQLRVFSSVYKNKSFSRASEELDITQPTVSDHIRIIEEKLACRLFDRLGRTILPTKDAEVLYSHVIGIIEKVNTLEDTFNRSPKEISEELVVGACPIPGAYLMPRIIREFKKKYREVSYNIIIGAPEEIIDKILKHALLIGIVSSMLSDSRLKFTHFMDDELIFVTSPSLIEGNVLSLEEAVNVPVIRREAGSYIKSEENRMLGDKGIEPENLKVLATFNSTDAIKQAAQEGLGMAILSKLSVANELKLKTLKEVKVSDIQMKRKLYLVTHKKRTLSVAYCTFMEYLLSRQ